MHSFKRTLMDVRKPKPTEIKEKVMSLPYLNKEQNNKVDQFKKLFT